jgi:hypothetical protein
LLRGIDGYAPKIRSVAPAGAVIVLGIAHRYSMFLKLHKEFEVAVFLFAWGITLSYADFHQFYIQRSPR